MASPSGGFDDREHAPRSAVGIPRDRRVVTVLFVDVAGATEIVSKMDAELATSVLLPVVTAMRDAVERYGGSITKLMGDGLMAMFGVPNLQEDHAVRACHAALAIQTNIGLLDAKSKSLCGKKIEVRVGIHSGTIVLTTASDKGYVTYDTYGDVPSLANRIETAAEPGSIAISEHTARRVQHLFDCQPLGTRVLKGFTEPQPIYRLAGFIEKPRPKQVPEMTSSISPLVGRTRELTAIEERFDALERSEGSFLLILGEPGIGKSRLLQEAKAALKRQVIWLEGHSLSFGQRLSYWPFIEMLKPWLDIHGAKSGDEMWLCIERKIFGLMGEEGEEILPYIATLLGFELREPYLERVRYLDSESLGGQILRAVWRLFERMAREHPVVMVIDDLHWIDKSSGALIEHLLPLAVEGAILFCFTSRPEGEALSHLKGVAEAVPRLKCTELVLSPLSVEDSQRLLAGMIGTSEETNRLRDMVLYKAEGNPFFAEELIRTLIDLKVLVHGDTGWSANDQDIVLPDTVQDVIMARVDRLDERLKQVLGIASVIGRSFFYRVLRAVSESGDDLDERLSRLKSVEIIDELKSAPELAYLFRHALAQEAVYESVLVERRKSIHERVAECIELIYEDRVREVASVLAFHYARAENWEKALKALLEAADQSARMAADDEALIHYQEAIATYSRVFGESWDRKERAHVERRLGEIYLRRGDHPKALAHLTKALSLLGEHLPVSRFAARLVVGRELVIQILHRILPSLFLKKMQTDIDPAEDTRYKTFETLAWTVAMLDHDHLVAVCLRVLNYSERRGFVEGVAKGRAGFGFGLDGLGWHGLARSYFRRALRMAEESGNPSAIGLVNLLHGIHQFVVGHWDEAIASYDKAREITGRVGDLSAWADTCAVKCEVLAERGRFNEVMEIADEMINLGRQSAFQPAYRWGMTMKGKALRRVGRLVECEPLLKETTELSIRDLDFLNLGSAQCELAFCQIELGRFDEARRNLEDCQRVLTEHRIMTFTLVYHHVGLALLGILGAERSPDAKTRDQMLRACREAHRISQIYQNGLPVSMRLMGTAQWLLGRPKKAEQWWRQSQEAAERLAAPYQAGLTLAERGRRTESAKDVELSRSIFASLGLETRNIEQVPVV